MQNVCGSETGCAPGGRLNRSFVCGVRKVLQPSGTGATDDWHVGTASIRRGGSGTASTYGSKQRSITASGSRIADILRRIDQNLQKSRKAKVELIRAWGTDDCRGRMVPEQKRQGSHPRGAYLLARWQATSPRAGRFTGGVVTAYGRRRGRQTTHSSA